MKSLVAYFVHRPLLVNIMLVGVLVMGAYTLVHIPKESFPPLTLNSISVQTLYPGASATDVELNVTAAIEEAVQEVNGVDRMESISREGVSTVIVYADEDADDARFREIQEDVDGAVSRVSDLPDGVDGKPVLSRLSTRDIPSLEIALAGPASDVRSYAAKLQRLLGDLAEVARIQSVGLPDMEVEILVDPARARAKEVDLLMIAGAIQQRNVGGSGGSMESFLGEKRVVVYSRFDEYQDVLNTDVRRSVDGYGIKLRDVAEVRLAEKDDGLDVRSNGQSGASLLVVKKPSADVVRVIDDVRETLERYPPPQSVEAVFLEDRSRLTRSRLKLLGANALLGMLLIGALLLLIYDRRIAFWTAAGIPVALLLMMLALPRFDLSFSALALGAMVLVLGILVDDAIVIAEEIARGRERGLSPTEAAIQGVSNIWQPVFASVTTTAIAFSPLLFLGGLPGKFIWVVPLVVVLTLLASMAECFFMLPAHLAHGGEHRRMPKKRFVKKLERGYLRSLAAALKYRYVVLGVFVSLLGLALFSALNFVQGEAFPKDGAEKFTIRINVPGEVQLDKTREVVEALEREIQDRISGRELEGFSSRIGTHNGQNWSDRGNADNLAILFVYLTPVGERERTAPEIVDDIRTASTNLGPTLHGAEVVIDMQAAGPPSGPPVQYRVSSNKDQQRREAVQQVTEFLKNAPGVVEVETDELASVDDLNLVPDYETLARAGLSVENLLLTLRIAFDGLKVGHVTTPDGRLDFRLRLNDAARANPGFLASLPLASPVTGAMLDLNRFVTLEEQPGVMEIRHSDAVRTTTVSARIDDSVSAADIGKQLQDHFASTDDVFYELSGEAEANDAVFGDLYAAAALALLGIYATIALILNSVTRPLVIMSCVPFGAAGVIGGLLLHGLPLSAFAVVGLIGLSGIVVNDSILMAYRIQGAASGAPAGSAGSSTAISDRSILRGATGRLRPILLTSITTISGLAPTAFGIGGYDFFISPMCLAMAYGLFFGTAIVLYLMPCLLRALEDLHAVVGSPSKNSIRRSVAEFSSLRRRRPIETR